MTATDIHFDMYDRELYASPYAMYRRLRDEAPLYRNEEYDFWAVSRHEDVGWVLGDRDTFCSRNGSVYQIASARHRDAARAVHLRGPARPPDPPEPGLPPLHAEGGQPHRAADQRAVPLGGRGTGRPVGRFDFVKDFATMLPIAVIGMLLGLPEKDHADLRARFHRLPER